MPTLTTLRMRFPVAPVHAPERTSSEKVAMRSRTAWTSATTSWPSTTREVSRGIRRATWSTARSSVTLMWRPANMSSMRRRRPARSARATRRVTVSAVTMFFE